MQDELMAHPLAHLATGIPERLRNALGLACLGVATVFAFSYSGPYRWFAELQMQLIGEYYPVLTWLLTMLLMAVVLLAALQVPRKLGLFGDVQTTVEEHEQQVAESNARWAKRRPALMLLAIGCTLGFLGGRDWLQAQHGRTLERMSVAALEAGKRPSSTWMEVSGGDVAWEATIELEHGTSTTSYVPVLSPDWERDSPIALVLRIDRAQMEHIGREGTAFQGATDPEGLPGSVRAAFADGQIDASSALVLQVGKRPAAGEGTAQVLFAIGVLCVIAGIIAGLVQLRRERSL